MKKMNNEKIRNQKPCLPINIVVKAMLDTLYFPGQEVNQHSSTSSSVSSTCF